MHLLKNARSRGFLFSDDSHVHHIYIYIMAIKIVTGFSRLARHRTVCNCHERHVDNNAAMVPFPPFPSFSSASTIPSTTTTLFPRPLLSSATTSQRLETYRSISVDKILFRGKKIEYNKEVVNREGSFGSRYLKKKKKKKKKRRSLEPFLQIW